MIKAEIYSNGDKITGFSILGHSGTAPRGHDIYCAGVSALSQSAYLALVNHLKFDGDAQGRTDGFDRSGISNDVVGADRDRENQARGAQTYSQ